MGLEIVVTKEKYDILSKSINNMMVLLKEISCNSKNANINEKYKIALLEITIRIFPNLKAIDTLLFEYFNNNYKGLHLSIGLIMRCCLEDIILGTYLLTFKKELSMINTEIDVKSLQFFKSYINFIVEKEPEFYTLEEEKVNEIKKENLNTIKNLMNKFPVFYEGDKLTNITNIRRKNVNSKKYFNEKTIGEINMYEMYSRIKENDFKFSYIYFLYKFYCLFEHYTYYPRNIIELNPDSFGKLVVSYEFICRGLQKIIPFVTDSNEYDSKLSKINKNLKKMSE